MVVGPPALIHGGGSYVKVGVVGIRRNIAYWVPLGSIGLVSLVEPTCLICLGGTGLGKGSRFCRLENCEHRHMSDEEILMGNSIANRISPPQQNNLS